MKSIIDKLAENKDLTNTEYKKLLANIDEDSNQYLFQKANSVREKYYGKKVFLRGLIEISNYCKNDCYYCGIRRSNNINRYRLLKEQILECVEIGTNLGYKTFVLQGGEDFYYSDDLIIDIIREIKIKSSECAVTLSIGEKSFESYKKFFDAGADRYLLRHETANDIHYNKLHPNNLTLKSRKECLNYLKEIGYQVGTGFMVGSPYQTSEDIINDLRFIKEINPQMIGIGPFIPAKNTPFESEKPGDVNLTLKLIAIIRLLIPNGLIPSTTALGSIDKNGREKGLMSGANVVMPNLSPVNVRSSYALYDNKISTGEEAAEGKLKLEKKIISAGFTVDYGRGDYISINAINKGSTT